MVLRTQDGVNVMNFHQQVGACVLARDPKMKSEHRLHLLWLQLVRRVTVA